MFETIFKNIYVFCVVGGLLLILFGSFLVGYGWHMWPSKQKQEIVLRQETKPNISFFSIKCFPKIQENKFDTIMQIKNYGNGKAVGKFDYKYLFLIDGGKGKIIINQTEKTKQFIIEPNQILTKDSYLDLNKIFKEQRPTKELPGIDREKLLSYLGSRVELQMEVEIVYTDELENTKYIKLILARYEPKANIFSIIKEEESKKELKKEK